MTAGEALAVAKICCTADGSCQACARDLIEALVAKFPEHGQVFTSEFERFHEMKLEDA